MRSLFDQDAMEDILNRLDHLEENTKPSWGKMSVGQMAWHCQIPLKVALKNKPPKKRPNPLIALFYKKSLYNDKPWRKGLPTAPFAKATEPKELSEELPRLRELVKEVHQLRGREQWNPHPIFGVLTHEQWGQMQYKHLDHHLRQFGL